MECQTLWCRIRIRQACLSRNIWRHEATGKKFIYFNKNRPVNNTPEFIAYNEHTIDFTKAPKWFSSTALQIPEHISYLTHQAAFACRYTCEPFCHILQFVLLLWLAIPPIPAQQKQLCKKTLYTGEDPQTKPTATSRKSPNINFIELTLSLSQYKGKNRSPTFPASLCIYQQTAIEQPSTFRHSH